MNQQPPATPPTKTELIDLIRRDRQRLERLIAHAPPDRITQPGVENDWSIKDIMAHVADWEQYVVRRIDAALHGRPLDQRHMPNDAAMDQINADNIDRSRHHPLDQIQAAFAQSADQVIAVLEQLSDDDLWSTTTVSERFNGPLWQHIAVNTYEHYVEHSEPIEAWLRAQGIALDQ